MQRDRTSVAATTDSAGVASSNFSGELAFSLEASRHAYIRKEALSQLLRQHEPWRHLYYRSPANQQSYIGGKLRRRARNESGHFQNYAGVFLLLLLLFCQEDTMNVATHAHGSVHFARTRRERTVGTRALKTRSPLCSFPPLSEVKLTGSGYAIGRSL